MRWYLPNFKARVWTSWLKDAVLSFQHDRKVVQMQTLTLSHCPLHIKMVLIKQGTGEGIMQVLVQVFAPPDHFGRHRKKPGASESFRRTDRLRCQQRASINGNLCLNFGLHVHFLIIIYNKSQNLHGNYKIILYSRCFRYRRLAYKC